MSIQTIDRPTTYQELLPLYLLALKGGEEDERYMGDVRVALFIMAKRADRWLAHCDEIDAKNPEQVALHGGES